LAIDEIVGARGDAGLSEVRQPARTVPGFAAVLGAVVAGNASSMLVMRAVRMKFGLEKSSPPAQSRSGLPASPVGTPATFSPGGGRNPSGFSIFQVWPPSSERANTCSAGRL